MKKISFIFIIVLLISITGCGAQNSHQSSGTNNASNSSPATSFKIAKAETTKNINITNDTVGPVVDVVHVGDTVTWTNTDSSSHRIVSYPNTPVPFKIDIQENQKGTYEFTKPGVYRYYGGNVATYSKKMGDVEATKKSKVYPIPMRGVVVVLNAKNALPVSPSPKVDIPDSTMMFTPWSIAVNKGTTITWSNHDDMQHVVASVPGYVSQQTKTLTLKSDSGAGKLTFGQPGVYYYYCFLHASWDKKAGQMIPLKSYGSYPYIMDGLIIVNP